jgi:hypothetical protein
MAMASNRSTMAAARGTGYINLTAGKKEKEQEGECIEDLIAKYIASD